MPPSFVLRLGYDGWSQVLALAGPVTIGRAPECTIHAADPRLSRQHAALRPLGDGVELSDLGSQAGTHVGGERIAAPRLLKVGDRFEVGPISGEVAEPEAPSSEGIDVARILGAIDDLYGADDVGGLLVTIVDRAIELVGADRGALLGEGGLEASVARGAGGFDLPADEILTRSLPRRALTTGAPAVFTDVGAFEDAEGAPRSVAIGGLRTVVCVPLPGALGPIGVLYLDARRATDHFDGSALAALEVLAGRAGLAIERARLRERVGEQEASRRQALQAENAHLRARVSVGEPIGTSEVMRRCVKQVRQLAASDVTVCLTGETGTGKDVFARYLHQSSARAAKPFVPVDCGSIPENLIESELFGHTKGAFTGAASARLGHVREADGGTLFLDEIGELPLHLQTRLLRVLQERTVQPVGATARVPVDVRVICATHRDLKMAVREGRFRQDLYYRLAVVEVPLPPLRDRGEDVLLLARHFLAELGAGRFEGFTREAAAAMLRDPWAGNVRELQHRVQRAVALGQAPWVTVGDLGLGEVSGAAASSELEPDADLLPIGAARAEVVARFERSYLEAAMRRTGGNMAAAAVIAGLTRQGMHRLVQAHGLDRTTFRRDP